MDDLLGEDWQAPSKPSASNAPSKPNTFAASQNSFRATPTPSSSNIASPLGSSRPPSAVNGRSTTPQNDQFGNLLSLKSQKAASSSSVSIQERQKQLVEEKRRQQDQQSQLWDKLGSGTSTPEVRGPSPMAPIQDDEDDILAAFNKAAPVDKASHFPPPQSEDISRRSTPAQSQQRPVASSGGFNDDDDPFGLGSAPVRSNGYTPASPQTVKREDDDILGDLGKPLIEGGAKRTPLPTPEVEDSSSSSSDDLETNSKPDQRVAELVEMGFPEDTAAIALAESGGDVQNAVSWLLRQAHEESKAKALNERGDTPARVQSPNSTRRPRQDYPDGMLDPAVRRADSRSPANGEKDAAQVAQDFGSKFLKGANSLWKASQKQMAKTMAEFQQERDPSQPKWMQDASTDTSRSSSQNRRPERSPQRNAAPRQADVTNEAALLDMPRERPAKPSKAPTQERNFDPPPRDTGPAEKLSRRDPPQLKYVQQPPAMPDRRPATKLSRQEVEDQTAQAYISPARRKKSTPKPEPQPQPEVDLFSPAPAKAPPVQTANSTRPNPSRATPVSRASAAPAAPKPQAPPRHIPSISPSALSTSTSHRKAGGESFKRGDYASAHESYTAALTPLPQSHPIAIIVYCNRSLTALKTGDAKTAVSDADQALAIIGVSQGVGETIDLQAGEGAKDMREFYGKALMRKAEALEHLEKWTDAGDVWKSAIAAGVGGAISLRGRDRCEKAATPAPAKPAPRPKPTPASKPPPPAKSLGNSIDRPVLTTASSGEAVKKLRAANAAAEKADDEKFALTDQVDARLTAWKGGKEANLRALLQSLDTVLWDGAGWKKVGMSDLVIAGKVKVIYMKAIAKVHPDKIPQDATTEQRMVSGAVFSTLNEAWDRFRKENNL